jgi:hypothetical protein
LKTFIHLDTIFPPLLNTIPLVGLDVLIEIIQEFLKSYFWNAIGLANRIFVIMWNWKWKKKNLINYSSSNFLVWIFKNFPTVKFILFYFLNLPCTCYFYCILIWLGGSSVKPHTPLTIWWPPSALQHQFGGHQVVRFVFRFMFLLNSLTKLSFHVLDINFTYVYSLLG